MVFFFGLSYLRAKPTVNVNGIAFSLELVYNFLRLLRSFAAVGGSYVFIEVHLTNEGSKSLNLN